MPQGMGVAPRHRRPGGYEAGVFWDSATASGGWVAMKVRCCVSIGSRMAVHPWSRMRSYLVCVHITHPDGALRL